MWVCGVFVLFCFVLLFILFYFVLFYFILFYFYFFFFIFFLFFAEHYLKKNGLFCQSFDPMDSFSCKINIFNANPFCFLRKSLDLFLFRVNSSNLVFCGKVGFFFLSFFFSFFLSSPFFL